MTYRVALTEQADSGGDDGIPACPFVPLETGKERVYDHSLYHLFHDDPNLEMTSFVFRETLMIHLLIWGNAYAQIIRDGNGRVYLRQEDVLHIPGLGFDGLVRYSPIAMAKNVDGLLCGDYQSRMTGYSIGRQNG